MVGTGTVLPQLRLDPTSLNLGMVNGVDTLTGVINAANIGTATLSLDSIRSAHPLFSLAQNFPNTFNPVTTIRYSIPIAATVTLTLFDVSGRKVATLISDQQSAGTYDFQFDGGKFASGVYFYRLKTDSGFLQIRRMLLIK